MSRNRNHSSGSAKSSTEADSPDKHNEQHDEVEMVEPQVEPDAAHADSQMQEDNDVEAGSADQHMSLEQALERLDAAESALASHREDVLRVQAEMQNLRRRTEQDVERAHKYGQEKFASELLVVIDNLERALQAVENPEDERIKPLCDGVQLTLKSFTDCFKKFTIEQIDPLGEPFNPQLHQAVVMHESPDAEPNTVISVMQKGYTLHGRVLRPAMVVVSKEPSGE
jgi:molecular chaperone GrpE